MNIKDLDPTLLQTILDQMESLHPGLLQSLQNKEADKRRLCQEEQNLTEQIDKTNRQLASLTNTLENKIREVTNSLHEDYDPHIDDLKGRIQALIAKRTVIHQEYISKYPASKPVQNLVLREIFQHFYRHYLNAIPDGYGLDKEVTNKLYKRFDNLIHNRCKTTELFGYDWTISDICEFLNTNDQQELANKVYNFWKSNV